MVRLPRPRLPNPQNRHAIKHQYQQELDNPGRKTGPERIHFENQEGRKQHRKWQQRSGESQLVLTNSSVFVLQPAGEISTGERGQLKHAQRGCQCVVWRSVPITLCSWVSPC